MLQSTAVHLGDNANHTFTYRVDGRPEGHLDVMMLTEGPNGASFSHYQRFPISPGNTVFHVPPPPALRGTIPYVLVGAVRSEHQGDAPQDLDAFFDWIDASDAPFTYSGQLASREQFKAARRAAEAWANEFWVDEDKRRTVQTGIASEKFAEFLNRELPSHRLSWEGTSKLIEVALDRSNLRGKRNTSDLKPCEVCTLAVSAVFASVGLGGLIYTLARRPPGDIENPQLRPRHINTLLDWMLTRIRANYADAKVTDIVGSITGHLALGLNGADLVWKGVSGLAETMCRKFTDC